MERTNLTLGDVINQMQVGELAIIVNSSEELYSPGGYRLLQPPSAIYWDEKDDLILKSTINRNPTMIGKSPDNERALYRIVSAEEYYDYLQGFQD